MVLVATRVHGTVTDRQQPKHALTAHARTSEEQHELLRPADDDARTHARTRRGAG